MPGTNVPDAAQTLPELSMSDRWSPHPRRPAAQAEAALSAGGGADADAGLRLLDVSALNRLRELDPGGRSGLLKRVLRTYTLSLERMLLQWQAARAVGGLGDLVAMRTMAHTLKSSSASVGALELSALCAEVEARLRDERLEGVEAELDALSAEAARIFEGLRDGCGACQ
jgi:histidine phosphotransfer protein HptB